MPKVDYEHPAYKTNLPCWEQIEDCLKGDRWIKKQGDKYLPRPNPSDESDENKERYKQYIQRAVFYNFTGRTLAGLVGQVFAKPPVIETDNLLETVTGDADGAGVSLLQQSKAALAAVMSKGRGGLFVDYPETEGPATIEQQEAGAVRPNIIFHEPESIINWRTIRQGARNLLSLVVIKENYNNDDDGFGYVVKPQIRALRLVDGIYTVQIWQKQSDEKEAGEYSLINEFVPTDSSGLPLREIPFQFIGWENNDPTPDLPPLYDLSVLNVGHYRNSADYEESVYMVGQPTPWFAGLTREWVDEVLEGTIQLGARAAVPLPEGASAGLLQASPNTLPKEAMEHKEKQAIAIGAKLVEARAVQQTATEAGINNASETSVLSSGANNVTSAYVRALKWCVLFMGASDKFEFELNTDFEIHRLSPQDAQALLAMWQGEGISWEEYRFNLKRSKIAYLEDEVAKAQIEAENPIDDSSIDVEPDQDEE